MTISNIILKFKIPQWHNLGTTFSPFLGIPSTLDKFHHLFQHLLWSSTAQVEYIKKYVYDEPIIGNIFFVVRSFTTGGYRWKPWEIWYV